MAEILTGIRETRPLGIRAATSVGANMGAASTGSARRHGIDGTRLMVGAETRIGIRMQHVVNLKMRETFCYIIHLLLHYLSFVSLFISRVVRPLETGRADSPEQDWVWARHCWLQST